MVVKFIGMVKNGGWKATFKDKEIQTNTAGYRSRRIKTTGL
jgi:Txe/YoeB family toxin of Txe-Axe toxin-antitoxin module